MQSISELRPAAEAMSAELSGLLWDRRVHERVAGIIRSNPRLLAKAEAGNPYINGVRRWWGIASALVLRRHVDQGTQGSLRWLVERLVAFDDDVTGSSPSTVTADHKDDLNRLERISVRFRPYLNAAIYGSGVPDSVLVTFNDLQSAIDEIAEIGQRTYKAVTNISRRFEPVEQFEWTEIFEEPWINNVGEGHAYVLGEEGVPYDAVAMTTEEARGVARLVLKLNPVPGNRVLAVATNDTETAALDVRVFLPYLRTVIDTPEIPPHSQVENAARWHPTDNPKFGWGQAVIEFADVFDNIYRQYADVDFINGRVWRLTQPYHVKGRIVAPRPYVYQ